MPTIANMPHADIRVQYPDNKVRTVNLIRLLVQVQNAEHKAQFGFFLPGVNKLKPTVAALRAEYPGIITAKTWEQAANELRALYNALREAAASIRQQQSEAAGHDAF